LWDVANWQLIGELCHGYSHADETISLAFSAIGGTLASGGYRSIRFWDIPTLQPVGEVPQGHSYDVGCLDFSPDGRVLASGDDGGIIRLWNVETRQPLGEPLRGHANRLVHLTFSKDGHTLTSMGCDGTALLWDTSVDSWRRRARRIAGRELNDEERRLYLADELNSRGLGQPSRKWRKPFRRSAR